MRHQGICQLFFEINLQEKFPALNCHPSRRKCIHLQTGGWAGGGGQGGNQGFFFLILFDDRRIE
jgi:hypothetical protein